MCYVKEKNSGLTKLSIFMKDLYTYHSVHLPSVPLYLTIVEQFVNNREGGDLKTLLSTCPGCTTSYDAMCDALLSPLQIFGANLTESIGDFTFNISHDNIKIRLYVTLRHSQLEKKKGKEKSYNINRG